MEGGELPRGEKRENFGSHLRNVTYDIVLKAQTSVSSTAVISNILSH